jgi:hypothetical protein
MAHQVYSGVLYMEKKRAFPVTHYIIKESLRVRQYCWKMNYSGHYYYNKNAICHFAHFRCAGLVEGEGHGRGVAPPQRHRGIPHPDQQNLRLRRRSQGRW